jgi:dCMP deaminase
MDLADLVSTWSKDPSTQVSAVIVDDQKKVVSLGYNGFPRGVEDLIERYGDRELKHKLVCHAERNALDNSPRSVVGCTLYCTLEPCADCAKSIIQNGIKKVITRKSDREDTFNWEFTRLMFKEAGVELEYYKED